MARTPLPASARVDRSVRERAKKLLDRWESDQRSMDAPERKFPQVKSAIDQYLRDCGRRKLSPATVRGYQNSLQHLAAFFPGHEVSELGVAEIRAFASSRSEAAGRRREYTSSQTLRKELEHLRAFFEFCIENEWMAANPARKVRSPKDDSTPTLPFGPEEVKALLAACDEIDNRYDVGIERARLRARALVLLLLYSGLRIGDAVKLERFRVDKSGRLLIRMEKTKEPLYVKLPSECLDALGALPKESEYYFWSGKALFSTAVGSARRTIACLARMTGINAHPHRFRDTFSVELLKSGADLRTVQKLLGHTSIKTTEKHYAPWVRDFQRHLDKATARLKFVG